ncbi:MAG TPA: DUF1203 domain-containing protein [Xanthomonadaceae bacterium]|jgi:hypothetical protein|nr:DUF1203 domain-containing protein [Xanthomonadaceae bacterium]
MSSFQIVGIDHRPFEALFELDDAQLREHGAVRCIATEYPGFPCRVGLDDAAVGDELLLLPFEHQPGNSPYRASGPIFVRRGATRAKLPESVIPSYVTRRLISVRAYDDSHMMVDAAVREGADAASEIERQFANAAVAYIHLHNAKRGCYSCRVDRA